jgi:hypothetical protein
MPPFADALSTIATDVDDGIVEASLQRHLRSLRRLAVGFEWL